MLEQTPEQIRISHYEARQHRKIHSVTPTETDLVIDIDLLRNVVYRFGVKKYVRSSLLNHDYNNLLRGTNFNVEAGKARVTQFSKWLFSEKRFAVEELNPIVCDIDQRFREWF